MSSVIPSLAGMAAAGSAAVGASAMGMDPHIIDAHLAVQATIRSYQVRGHLAAQIDPLKINNMSLEAAKKMIIRSTTIYEQDMDTVFQLPGTTWIGGKVSHGCCHVTELATKRYLCRRKPCLCARSSQGWKRSTAAPLAQSLCTSAIWMK